eukprot:767320-Hanusia_phi.AAC.5
MQVETSFSFEVQEMIMKARRQARIFAAIIDPDERFYTAGEGGEGERRGRGQGKVGQVRMTWKE